MATITAPIPLRSSTSPTHERLLRQSKSAIPSSDSANVQPWIIFFAAVLIAGATYAFNT